MYLPWRWTNACEAEARGFSPSKTRRCRLGDAPDSELPRIIVVKPAPSVPSSRLITLPLARVISLSLSLYGFWPTPFARPKGPFRAPVISLSTASGQTPLRGLRALSGPNSPTLPGHGHWRSARSHQPLEPNLIKLRFLTSLLAITLFCTYDTRLASILLASAFPATLRFSFFLFFFFPLFWARRLTAGGYLRKDMGHGFSLTLWRQQG
jgi:hypothetical protein